jgi:mono/diheme cytochrome c family protein
MPERRSMGNRTWSMTMWRLRFAVTVVALTAALIGPGMRVSAGQAGAGQRSQAFTAEQATAGKVAYSWACARCHMPDLGGTADAPPLSGTRFLDTWRARTTKELFDFVVGAMPPGGPAVNGDITADTYAAILAYVLQSNGGSPGETPLEPSVVVPLERVVRAASGR